MMAIQPKTSQILGVNQQAYQSLKAAMSLNLRRQLLVAVCDNVVLQNQLATQLERDLAGISQLNQPLDRLVFDPEDAHLPRQVAQWVRQMMLAERSLPQVQMLGIEQMTRQPALIQNHFLRSLEQVEALLPRLNTSLLVWLPWPWLRTIQSSSPTFWKWRNGVFEFVSDPVPTSQAPELLYGSDHGSDHGSDRGLDREGLHRADSDDDYFDDEGLRLEPSAAPLLKADRLKDDHSEYPCIDLAPHQVVALYGETDDSDISDEGQPKLEEVATWDVADRLLVLRAASSAVSSPEANQPEISLEIEDSEVDHSETSLEVEELEPVESEPERRNSTATVISTAHQEDALSPADQVVMAVNQQTQRQHAADDYFEVGRSYRRRIEAGERGLELIEPAIAAYEGALRCLSGPHPDWGSGLNDLGTLYWLKAQQLDDQQQVADCMNHSVELYSQALTKIDLNQSEEMACQLYSNLGAVFSMLATTQAPVLNFKEATKAYLKALPFCSLAKEPQEFATLQNSLGSVYWKLSHYEQDSMQIALYLQQAITAYEQAALAYSPYERPLDYAAVQNNLGITYWTLAKQEKSVSALKRAIAAYRDALNYRTPKSDGAACAITHNNLALAYWDLSKAADVPPAYKRASQRNALISFEAALHAADSAGTLGLEDRAAILHCLGDVHAQMVDGALSSAEAADSLTKSLRSYVQAIDNVSMESPVFKSRLTAIVANLRSHKEQLGLNAQQAAFNEVPPHLVSLVMQSM